MRRFESWPDMFLTLTTYHDDILLPELSDSKFNHHWRADNRHLLTRPRYGIVRYGKLRGTTFFFNSSDHFFFTGDVSYTPEKGYVFSYWNPHDLTSQRPPPLMED